jgi:putative tryptophan/tyrosine transport system substrate-binding protein
MRRREFITLLGDAAAWPFAARAQQREQMRRIGFLSVFAESDPQAQGLVREFVERLQELGWVNGRNVQVDFRFGDADLGLLSTLAADIVELRPDVIFAAAAGAASAARQRNRPTYRSSNQPSSSLSSTSRPRRPSASKFRRRSSRAPTR